MGKPSGIEAIPIRNYEHYFVTQNGDVVNSKTKRVLKKYKKKNGYEQVCLSKNGVAKHLLLHRIVANAFRTIGVGPYVNHKDGNKRNNHCSNLEWVTASGNMKHAVSLGLIKQGSSHHNSKLTEEDVTFIRSHKDKPFPYKEMGQKYSISHTQLYNIITNKTRKTYVNH